MTITLYHCKDARSLRPLWVLEELGLDYELVSLPFPPRVLAKEFREINPLATVPFLIDGDVRLTESVAMCQYLVELYASGSPLAVGADEPDYGAYLNWLAHSDATLTFPLTLVFRYTHLEPEQRRLPQAAGDYKAFFLGRLRLLKAAVAERRYLCSDRFTIADICVSYALHMARGLDVLEVFEAPVDAYWDRVTSRPAYQRAIGC